ncbi:NAD(P)-dependent oxidoreductase [Pseudomonas syringae]|uniref:NADH-flavin reductase n=1 Tax=Pseudomonas syringae TaxID=317 RepID=A0A085VE14_PSESX|nr:NAD(P)H-binding protein [Pseudomonas syringae]KFE53677.1 NADH-flavin reductase [Pseudomonas syringae]
MKNAETPVIKIVLFGAISSLGSALMAEMLRRQHEVIAILDDLNALAPRPGLRTKVGSLFDAERVSESIAGSSAVICLLDAKVLPVGAEHDRPDSDLDVQEQTRATQTLLAGMQRMNIKRLILVGDFVDMDDSRPMFQSLRASDVSWTLVNAPQGVAGLSIEHFSQVSSSLEPGLAEPLERLARVAAGIADELRLNLHVRELVNFLV